MHLSLEKTPKNIYWLLLYAGIRIQESDVSQWCATDLREIIDWAGAHSLHMLGIPGLTVPDIPNPLRRYDRLTSPPRPWHQPPAGVAWGDKPSVEPPKPDEHNPFDAE